MGDRHAVEDLGLLCCLGGPAEASAEVTIIARGVSGEQLEYLLSHTILQSCIALSCRELMSRHFWKLQATLLEYTLINKRHSSR